MTNSQYFYYLDGKRKSDARFDPSDLADKFIEHFRENYRIQIKDEFGEKHSGYVGVTTGWRPAFILVFNKRCYGSSVLLSGSDTITKIYK